jgi:hypothetical protein
MAFSAVGVAPAGVAAGVRGVGGVKCGDARMLDGTDESGEMLSPMLPGAGGECPSRSRAASGSGSGSGSGSDSDPGPGPGSAIFPEASR